MLFMRRATTAISIPFPSLSSRGLHRFCVGESGVARTMVFEDAEIELVKGVGIGRVEELEVQVLRKNRNCWRYEAVLLS